MSAPNKFNEIFHEHSFGSLFSHFALWNDLIFLAPKVFLQKKFHFDAKCNEVCANNGVAKIVLVPKGEFFPLRNGQDMYVQLPFFMGVCELYYF